MRITLDSPGFEVKSENWYRANRPTWMFAKQRKAERNRTFFLWALSLEARRLRAEHGPFLVTLTRISKSAKGLDTDNLRGSFKRVRDAICELLGIDDAKTDVIDFEYKQERGRGFGFRIEIDALNGLR